MDKKRLIGIIDRFKLTDIWEDSGIEKPVEYALLTNEIHKVFSGMKASEYKAYKGIRKKSLRNNITDKRFNWKYESCKKRWDCCTDARISYEKTTSIKAISNENNLNYKYIDKNKQIT